MAFPAASSKYGPCHPPCSKPPLGSSSAPPGACMTPSSVRNSLTITLIATSFSSCLGALTYQTTRRRRTHRSLDEFGRANRSVLERRMEGEARLAGPEEPPTTSVRGVRTPPEANAIHVVISGPMTGAAIAGLCERVRSGAGGQRRRSGRMRRRGAGRPGRRHDRGAGPAPADRAEARVSHPCCATRVANSRNCSPWSGWATSSRSARRLGAQASSRAAARRAGTGLRCRGRS